MVGIYDHEEKLLKAVKKIRKAGIDIYDALTPFPVHGLEDAMGLKENMLHTAGFFFGLTGTSVGFTLITFISKFNYPLIVGGKPYWALPSYVPIMFEMTVLYAAVGMTITYMVRNELWPGRVPRIFDKRTTDDKFALTFAIDHLSDEEVNVIKNLLTETGASEVNHKEFESMNGSLQD